MEYDLQRFLKAQEPTYQTALEEIRSGRKRSHWMWYIFPQLACLGRSETARYYGIAGRDEALAYWGNPVLRQRLAEISQALLEQSGTAYEIFGSPDHLKLCSCMTLFSLTTGEPVFRQVLERFYQGKYDPLTVRFLTEH